MPNLLKKAVAGFSTLAMVATMFVGAATTRAATAGEVYKTSDGTVWFITSDMQRRPFTSAGAFMSYGFLSFSQVKDADASVTALPSGAFIAPQDGRIFCATETKGSDVKGECSLITGGMKSAFTSAAVFTGLGFSFSRAYYGDSSFLGKTSNTADTAAAHRPGVLVNNSGTVQLVVNGGLWGVPSLDVFNSWGWSFADVVPANGADKNLNQIGVIPGRVAGQLVPTATVSPTPQNGPISASLSAGNPSSGTIVAGQATAKLLEINLSGSGTVSSLTLRRSGISDQNTLSNVYLYDGATRLTDGYSFNSNSDLTMGSLGLAVNGVRTISVMADVNSAASSGQTIAVALTSLTASGSSASTVNVMGNTMTVASGSTLATTSLSANSLVGATPTINAGTTGYVFWSAPLQVNTRTLSLKSANFRMIGSAPTDALANIKLYVDGVDSGVAGVVTMTNGSNYVTFNLSGSPKSLQTGSHTLDIRADVQKGSSRTVQFSIQQASDLMIMDPQVGVNLAVTGTIPNVGANVMIGNGSITAVLDPTFSTQTTVTGGASNTTVGKFKLHAYGEDVKINSLVAKVALSAAATPAGIQNVTLYFNGSQVGSQVSLSAASGVPGTLSSDNCATTPGTSAFTCYTATFTLGSQLIVPAGTDGTVEVSADLRNAAGTNYTAGTISSNLVVGSSNATGQSSQNPINTPAVIGNVLTIQTGLLTVARNPGYANQNVSPNTAGVKIGSYVFQNTSSSEAVRVTNMNVALGFGGGTTITNLSGLRTSETSGSGSTPIQPQASNNFAVDFTLAPGASKTIDIFADSGSDTAGTVTATLIATSIGSVSKVSATSSGIVGQTITFSTGTIGTPTFVTASSTVAQYIAAGNGGATPGSVASYNFVSAGGSATISELKVTVTASTGTPVASVTIGSQTVPVVSGIAYFTNLSLAVPNGGSGLTQDVKVNYSEVGTSGVTPGTTASVALTYVKYTSGAITTTITPSVTAPTMTLVGSRPTLTVPSTQQTGLNIAGETKIGEVTVMADAKGNIKVNDIVFTVGSSGFSTAPTAIGSPRIALGNTTVSGSACAPASLVVTCEFGSTSNTDFDGLTVAAGTSVILSLFGTLTGAVATGSGTPTISSSVGASTFNWDDASTNGAAGSVNLSGTLIYQFPTNSFSIKQ